MKNKLYHFGSDCVDPNYNKYTFTKSLANKLNMDYNIHGTFGKSNLEIFQDILPYTFRFNENDIILINWTSFLILNTYWLKPINDPEGFEPQKEYRLHLLKGAYDDEFIIFQELISNYFLTLEDDRGVQSFHILDEKFNNFTHPLLKTINYKNGFTQYLKDNNYINDTDNQIQKYGLYKKTSIEPISKDLFYRIQNEDVNTPYLEYNKEISLL